LPSSQRPSIAGVAIDPTAIRPPIDDAIIERIEPPRLYDRAAALKADGYLVLLDIGGVDYLHREPRFDIVYHFLALPGVAASVAEVGTPRRLRLLVGTGAPDGTGASVPTLTDLWPNADWAEREIFDLYGVTFSGHPDLKRIQMPQDWEGHPLRKDYPLRGPARELTPRPAFALKSNVPAGAPPSGKVAAALQRQIARARGQDDSVPDDRGGA